METQTPKSYPTDVTDEECVFVTPYLVLMQASAPQCRHGLWEVFNGLRYTVCSGMQ